jgi:hypothetical protein
LPTIKIDLDPDSFRRLTELAVKERRPIPWQAEILLLRALGAPVEGGAHYTPPQPQEVPCAAE